MSPKKAKLQEPIAGKKPERNEKLLEFERELQSVRLELDEHKQLLKAARQDLELHTRQSETEASQSVYEHLEKLFQEIAGPAAQLVTQDHILNVQGKSLKAADIQAVSNRLIRVLQDYGLEIRETIGETVVFDKNLHQSLSSEEEIKDGEQVIVRMCGVSYRGKVLRLAAVSKQSNVDEPR